MINADDSVSDKQIEQSLCLVQTLFKDSLLGVYLYGSSVFGGLKKYSDIDLLVISDRPTSHKDKSLLVTKLLQISNVDPNKPGRPIELTAVVQSEVNPWHYPPNFDFQYGDWMRKEFESGNFEPWQTKTNPDLAIRLTQILLANKTLSGPEPNQLLDKVPYRDFISATVREIDSLKEDLSWDTRNVLLTYARMWSTVETDLIRSKPDAALWVIDRLPEEYKPVMELALAFCLGEKKDNWDDIKFIKPCVTYMIGQIKKQISNLETSDISNRSISLYQP